jgi:hypothetical protein
MLVRACQKIYIVSVEPHEARNRVSGDSFIGMANMRRAVRV